MTKAGETKFPSPSRPGSTLTLTLHAKQCLVEGLYLYLGNDNKKKKSHHKKKKAYLKAPNMPRASNRP